VPAVLGGLNEVTEAVRANALPPITTTVCPDSSGSRPVVAVVMIDPSWSRITWSPTAPPETIITG